MKNIKIRISLVFFLFMIHSNLFTNGPINDIGRNSPPIVDIAVLEKSLFDEAAPVDYDAENDYVFDERNYQKFQPQFVKYQNKQGQTLLMMLAAQEDQKKILKFALEELLMNPNLQDKQGQSALHYAVRGGNLLIVKLLLKNGANINLQDYEGTTPLYLATQGNFVAIANLLLQNGADRNLGIFETGSLPKDRIRTAAMKDVFDQYPIIKNNF